RRQTAGSQSLAGNQSEGARFPPGDHRACLQEDSTGKQREGPLPSPGVQTAHRLGGLLCRAGVRGQRENSFQVHHAGEHRTRRVASSYRGIPGEHQIQKSRPAIAWQAFTSLLDGLFHQLLSYKTATPIFRRQVTNIMTPSLADAIRTEDELDDLLTRPGAELITFMQSLRGRLLVLGAGGKMGPT